MLFNLSDLLISFFWMPILFLIGFYHIRKFPKKIRNYFVLGLSLKFIAALIFGIFSYTTLFGGDTHYYYWGGESFTKNFFLRFTDTLTFLWNDSSYAIENFFSYFSASYHLIAREPSYLVMKIGGLIGVLTLNSHTGICVFMAFFAFLGSWKIFQVFYTLYPHFHKPLAISTLFIPSTIIWSSGYGKDSIVYCSLGFLFYSSYKLFISPHRFRFKYLFVSIISSYLIIKIKVYVFLAFLPAFFIWLFLHKRNQISNKFIKNLSLPIFFTTGIIFGLLSFGYITSLEEFSGFAPEKAIESVVFYREHYERFKEEGIANQNDFSLGEFTPTILGLIKVAPIAINAVLVKPYIWEVRSFSQIPLAIENFFILLFILNVLFKRKRMVKTLLSKPEICFCFCFALILAFMIGISTANYGTMVRYRMPLIPFFLVGLYLLKYRGGINRKKIQKF